MLQADVVLINFWQRQTVGADVVADVVQDRQDAIRGNRNLRHLCGNRVVSEWQWRSGAAAALVFRVHHRYVMRERTAEDRAEETDIVVDLADRTADDGVGTNLVSEAEAAAEIQQVNLSAAVAGNAADTCNSDNARLQVGESSGSRTVDGLGEDDVPAHAVVEGQLWRNAPRILRVEAAPLLAIGCIVVIDIEPLELSDLPGEYRADSGAGASGVVEEELTSAVVVACVAQI